MTTKYHFQIDDAAPNELGQKYDFEERLIPRPD